MKFVYEDDIQWYHNFDLYGRYVSEIRINVTALDRDLPEVLAGLRSLKMKKLFGCPGHENLIMVKEFYANWNDHRYIS